MVALTKTSSDEAIVATLQAQLQEVLGPEDMDYSIRKIVRTEDGAWVRGWIWVYFEPEEEEQDGATT